MDLLSKLKHLKRSLINEGFVIEGIVGSYARGEATAKSDVDVLYHIERPFMQLHSGFSAFSRIEQIKQLMIQTLGKDVDLIASRGLSETAKKYMLSKVLDV